MSKADILIMDSIKVLSLKIQNLKKIKPIYLLSFSGVLLILVILLIAGNDSSEMPSTRVRYGDFLIELNTTGEIQAARSINVSAPRARTNLQIVKLVPEGTIVDSGDFLIQFDTEELQKEIEDKQSELEIAQANLKKSRASMQANMAQLVSALENSRASYELAELRLSQMAFEAEVKVQEERLRLKQSQISLEQAEAKIESQKQMDEAEITTLELKIKQAEVELEKARKQLTMLSLTAPAPGLVVYQKIWKGSDMEKIKIGDTPWRGQSLIQLPDLSQMQVETEISEADIGKLKLGQTVTVKLDAFPDPTFTGEITDIASLAHEKERENEIKVFDVIITLNEIDEVLKPGMTAKAKILVETIPDKFSVPIEAVFDLEGRQVVYPISNLKSPLEVVPGKRNDNFVIIDGAVKEGMLVSLVDPSKPVEIEPDKQALDMEQSSASNDDESSSVRVSVR